MNIMKRAFAILAIVIMLSVGTVLSACSPGISTEDAIRSDLAAQLDPFKNHDQATMDEIAESMGDAGLEEYSVNADDMVASMLDGFDYAIDSVSVDEDSGSASASVSITCKTFGDVVTRAGELATEFAISGEAAGMTEDELNTKLGEIIMQTIDEAEAKSTVCEFGYTKTDDGWVIDDDAENEIYNAFFA